LVKAGLISYEKVINMKFKEFEKLEKFNLMTKEIEELHYNENNSSFKGDDKPTESNSKGLTIKNDGSYKRN